MLLLLSFLDFQEDLQLALAETQAAMSACDDLLLTSTVWRYKICKFQAIAQLKLKIQDLKLQAAALSTTTTTTAPLAFQSTESNSV